MDQHSYIAPWYAASINGPTFYQCPSGDTNQQFGVVCVYSQNATANSGYSWYTQYQYSTLIAGYESWECIIQPHQLTNTVITAGFANSIVNAVDPAHGVYFRKEGATAAIYGKTADNSTRSTTATGYTMSTSTWYRLRIVINSDASTVNFYIYNLAGTQLWTDSLSANFPATRVGNGFAAMTTASAAAAALISIDYMATWKNTELTR